MVSHSGLKNAVGHCPPVNLLRHNLKPPLAVDVARYRAVRLLYLKLLARKYAALKHYGHFFARYPAVIIIKGIGYGIVKKVVKMRLFAHHLHARNHALPFWVNVREVNAVLCRPFGRAVRAVQRQPFGVRLEEVGEFFYFYSCYGGETKRNCMQLRIKNDGITKKAVILQRLININRPEKGKKRKKNENTIFYINRK